MRQRIEDLGRIHVLADKLTDRFEEFDQLYCGRKKDFTEWFEEQTPEMKDDVLHKLIYERESILNDLYEILTIANGTDRFNDPAAL